MFFGIFAVVILIDQITKHIAYAYLQIENTIPVINKVFYLTYLENSSDEFGIQKYNLWFIVAATAIIIIAAAFHGLRNPKDSSAAKIGTALLSAGVVSNMIDRIRWGFIIDFFDLLSLPVFNIADISGIAGGAVIIFILFFKGKRKSA